MPVEASSVAGGGEGSLPSCYAADPSVLEPALEYLDSAVRPAARTGYRS